MVSFLDPNSNTGLRSQLAKGFKGRLLVGVLTRKTNGDVDERGIPQTIETSYRMEGFVDNYSAFYRRNAGIPDNDVKIVLIAGNCDTDPIKDDRVKFANFPQYQIRAVETDPALAHFNCQSYSVI